MKEKSIKFTPQLGLVIVLAGVIIWLGSTYQIGAAPPEPTIEPSSTAEPPVGQHTTISIGEHMTIDIEIEGSPQSPATPSAAPLLQDSESASGSDNAISLLATEGHWTGTTSRGYPMSFDVASGGTTWSNFKLKTNFSVGGCSGTIETTVFGPGPITNNQFSSSTGSFSFSGQFSTPTSASGTYAYVNHFIPGCGNFTQSGTWRANAPSCADVFEPDGAFTSAKSIPVNGAAQTHNFHIPGDEDWVKFTMTVGRVYTITTSNLGSSNDTYMYLYNTNGVSILAQDDDSGPGFGSQIIWTATGSGTYYARVRHLNSTVGGCTGYNYNLAVTEGVGGPPVRPNPLIATPFSQTQINLLWGDNSNNETGFKIERSPNGTSGWTQIATVGANVVTYTDTGLTCNTTYFYQVRAYNGFGNSAYSNIANATTAACSGLKIYLPLIMKNFAPPPPPPPGSNPVDGHWTGTTSRSQPMSFDVSSGGTLLNNFKLKTNFQVGPCSGTLETTVSNPRAITNNQFSSSGGNFSFSGQFSTPTSASGTYAYVNHFIPGCGNFNQSGTWTAHTP